MPEPYCFDIETLLNDHQPDSVLVVGDGADEAVNRYLEQKQMLGRKCVVDRRSNHPGVAPIAGRYEIGIVTETIEYLEKGEAIHLLSRLRDLYTARFCVTVRIGEDWPDLKTTWTRNELLAIGMMLVNTYEDESNRRTQLYKYDISTYKPTPRWLNPVDWANPELWNKYRW